MSNVRFIGPVIPARDPIPAKAVTLPIPGGRTLAEVLPVDNYSRGPKPPKPEPPRPKITWGPK